MKSEKSLNNIVYYQIMISFNKQYNSNINK